jgi:hypothetical protein
MFHVGDTVSLRDPPGLATQFAVQTPRSRTWWPEKCLSFVEAGQPYGFIFSDRIEHESPSYLRCDTRNCRLAFFGQSFHHLNVIYFFFTSAFEAPNDVGFHQTMENTAGAMRKLTFVGLRSRTNWIARGKTNLRQR